ncbi:uncharacterized protein LOC127750688 [Frankliniella occidentalis]|uniref:Uncharacterized protein LOC127750688 n=1 Tax=Frankliniella occidentalis TaxID=133901 RepID=A0A9C6X4E5_FRAOC|nr:uncharacterized protein LOC127750688 [Frankliniella occidentalis]
MRRNSNTSNAAIVTQTDSGHKRPAEVMEDLDRKKLRVCEESRSGSPSGDSAETDQDDTDKQNMEEERLLNSPKTIPERIRTPDCFRDLDSPIGSADDKTETASVSTDLPFLRKLHKKELSKMSRSDLEELVVQKICEAITERSIVGDLRIRCQELEKRQEKEHEKFSKLRKQMTELGLVVKKYMEQQSKNPAAKIIKITRSVGLQVCQSIKHVQPCPTAVRTRLAPSPNSKVSPPLSKPAPANPLRPDLSGPEISCQVRTPVKSYRNSSTSPRSNIVSSTDPPSLVPTGSQRVEKVVVSVPSKPPLTPSPRLPVPTLQQLSGARPRLNIPTSASSAPPLIATSQPKLQSSPIRQSQPQSTNRPSVATSSDVEVIDIIDNDKTKKPGMQAGVQISVTQQVQQQKQAANAAAQNLATNSGMTVRLISPTQVSQAGVLSSGFPQLIMSNPSTGGPQKMILTSSQGSPIRGNLKLVVKGQQGNVIIPFSSSSGVSAQQMQQIFSNASISNKTPRRPNLTPSRSNSFKKRF